MQPPHLSSRQCQELAKDFALPYYQSRFPFAHISKDKLDCNPIDSDSTYKLTHRNHSIALKISKSGVINTFSHKQFSIEHRFPDKLRQYVLNEVKKRVSENSLYLVEIECIKIKKVAWSVKISVGLQRFTFTLADTPNQIKTTIKIKQLARSINSDDESSNRAVKEKDEV